MVALGLPPWLAPPRGLHRDELKARAPWLLATALGAVICWPGLEVLFQIWEEDAAYAHGSAVVLAALLLLLRDIPLGARRWSRVLPGSVALGVLGALWAAGQSAELATVSASLLPLVWLTLVWLAARGEPAAMFAPALLLLAVPAWNFTVPALQKLTIAVNESLLSLFAVPAWVSGDTVHLPIGRFIIEGGCSGLRYLLGAFTIVAFIGLWQRRRPTQIVLWLMLAAMFAVLLNQIRVFAIILVGYWSEMRSSLVHDHDWFGWVLFLVFFTPLVRGLLNARHGPREVVDIALCRPVPSQQLLGRLLLCISAMLLGSALVMLAPRGVAPLPVIDPALGPWQRELAPATWQSGYRGAQRELLAQFVSGGWRVDVQLASFARVSGLGGLLSEENTIADGLRWHLQEEAPDELDNAISWPTHSARLVDASGRERLALWWYEVDRQRYAGGLRTRLAALRSVVQGGDKGAGLLAFSVACARDCDRAAGALVSLLTHLDAQGGFSSLLYSSSESDARK
jgi:EpsI family protein